jgi:hypothetical protein
MHGAVGKRGRAIRHHRTSHRGQGVERWQTWACEFDITAHVIGGKMANVLGEERSDVARSGAGKRAATRDARMTGESAPPHERRYFASPFSFK